MSQSAPRFESPLAAHLSRALLFGLAYFLGGELGYALSLGPEVGGTFWPPSGLALAVFVAAPRRYWPALMLAGVIANFASDMLHGQTLPAAIGFAVANVGEPVLGATVLRALFPGSKQFLRLPEVAALALVAAFISTPLGAAVGALVAQQYTVNPPGLYAGWLTWWVGDAVGAVVLAPGILHALAQWPQIRAVAARRWLEAATLFVALAVITQILFRAAPGSVAMPFLVFPVLLVISLRLGSAGVGVGLLLVVVLTARDTADGLGPFAGPDLSLGERLVALQIYVGVMAAMFHGMALLWDERSRAAAALRDAHTGLEARYRRIVEQSPFAVATIDSTGNIKDANSAWRRLWPASGDARLDRLPKNARFEPLLERALAGEVVELPEHEIGASEGASRTVRGFAYPVEDKSGVVSDVVLIVRDVTAENAARRELLDANGRLREREEALSLALEQMAQAEQHREQLLAAERFARGEAERASQLKDQFLASLSHELRTPLHAIVGWTHILLHAAKDESTKHAARTIERNARAQAKLIDDLLDMSRITAGKVRLTLARTRLDEIVTAAADALRPVAEAQGLSLIVDTAGAPELTVSADAARLRQVLANLLDNSIKFTETGHVAVTLRRQGDRAEIVVADTGRGIPAEFLGDVFERFRQADGSITRRHGGLGLGLSIAKHLVEAHGGAIRAASDGAGRGATFTISLPLSDVAPLPKVEAPEQPRPADIKGLRVLVVDDQPDARELFARLLLEHDCHVTTAASATEALQLLSGSPHDVLLTDIGMPETDGYELLRRVRAAQLPAAAIAVTAFARREDRQRALDAGFVAHLAKPVDPAELVRTVARVASGELVS